MARFLVIAAASGIGQATVSLLEAAGHEVFTTARDQSKITPDAVLDATDFEAVERVFQQAGAIAGVVNCSGSLLLKAAHLTSKAQYQATIDASLTTAFATVRAAGKYMKNGGSVVLVSSAAALEGLANHEAIAAAKAGIIGLTLSAAASYAGNQLRVDAVAPGLTETPLTPNRSRRMKARADSRRPCTPSAGWASLPISLAPSCSCSIRPIAGLRGKCWPWTAGCRGCAPG